MELLVAIRNTSFIFIQLFDIQALTLSRQEKRCGTPQEMSLSIPNVLDRFRCVKILSAFNLLIYMSQKHEDTRKRPSVVMAGVVQQHQITASPVKHALAK